ncbi:hypothetical protein [Streptomyces sp. NPDC021224]|uniref:hypothetical protein n=1 Tax=unclassified Streptomyces TaxID=2593676 RepID=UPI00378F857F
MTGWEARRTELCDWLRANGVDPNQTRRDGELYIDTTADGQRILHAELYELDENGRRFLNERGDGAAIRQVAVPLLAEPPQWWQQYRLPTREQLLDAVYAVHRLHRAAEHQERTICVECSAYDGWTTTGNAPVTWPCATVAALQGYEKTRERETARQVGMLTDQADVA